MISEHEVTGFVRQHDPGLFQDFTYCAVDIAGIEIVAGEVSIINPTTREDIHARCKPHGL